MFFVFPCLSFFPSVYLSVCCLSIAFFFSLVEVKYFIQPDGDGGDDHCSLVCLMLLEMKPGQPTSGGVIRDKVQGGASPENEEPLPETSAEG